MNESVAIAKESDVEKEFSSTNNDNSIHRIRDEPERQLGSLRSVIEYISRDGGTPSSESIATELSHLPAAQRASVLLALQRTHGNRYVQRVVTIIQAKLTVGQPGDRYEQEADRIADAVMRMAEPEVERQIEEREELIPSKGISGNAPEVSDDLQVRLSQSKGGGQPLPDKAMIFMESRFGVDFSAVRIHADKEVAQMAREFNAEAFTHGMDIYFGAGRYSPSTLGGKKLLAHELTHVLQQHKGVHYKIIQREEAASAPTLPYDPNYGPSAAHCEVYQSTLAKTWFTSSYCNNAGCACLNTPDEPHNNCVRKCLQVKMREHLSMLDRMGAALPLTFPLEADPLCHDMWEQHVECYRECECTSGFINYPVFSIMCRVPFPCLFVGGSIAWFNSCL